MDNSSHISSSAQQRRAIIAKLKATGIAKGKAIDEGSSGEDQEYNFEKLKTFHIPRKKEQLEGKDLLTELPLHSREYMHTLYPAIKSSFFYPQSSRHIRIHKVELVNNQSLLREFLDKKKDMKDDGRSEKELSESFAFLHISNKNDVVKLCENGITVGNTALVSLGKPDMGVYVCKHADVVSLAPLAASDTGHILVFKVVKGKAKLVTECKGAVTNQEPTPLYDCHITKFNSEVSKGNHPRAYQALQYYIYEYGELDLVKKPRQILPHAVLHFSCVDTAKALQRRESFPLLDQTPIDTEQSRGLTFPNAGVGLRAFCLWKGKLLVKGGSFCNVEMRTDNDSAGNKAFLDNNINVKIFLSVANFSRHLPPTLLNKSGRKHNVVYRGRNYNIFTLTPTDEAGYGKFRQLIAHLVQKEAIAVVPLRMASCLYLIPHSNLTVNKMGIAPLPGECEKPNTQFLHVLIVTPKYLSTKVNDQKIYNLVTVRRRRDNQSESRVPEELDQKLRSMNIETSSAVSALQPDQHEKLLDILKDKKRMQNSDKLLHNHYKEPTSYFPSKLFFNKFHESVKNLWTSTCQTRLEYYRPKEKTPQPQKSILRADTTSTTKISPRKSGRTAFADSTMDVDAEATFSDEDDGTETKPYSTRSKSAISVQSYQLEKRRAESEKRKAPLEIDSKSAPPIKMSRPSFKALVEIILSASIEELMLHPDFVFSERFEKTHRVSKSAGFSQAFDLEQENQISVQFRQQIPFAFSKDCPYALDDDPVIKSMLRALYGTWESDGISEEENQKDLDKVNWVRNVLHKNKNQSTPSQHTVSSNENDRTVSDETSATALKESPSVAGSASADSGFASSSTTTTPNAAAPQTSSSFQDIANLLATVLQGKSASTDAPASISDEGDVATPQNIIQALVKTVEESGLDIPEEFKDIMEEFSMASDQTGSNDAAEDPGVPVESSPEPGLLSSSSSNVTPSMEASGGNGETTNSFNQPLQRQDPRMMKTTRSHPRLPLPSYRFPPSEKATQLLPKDGEAAQNLRPLTKRSDRETTRSDQTRTQPILNRLGVDLQKMNTDANKPMNPSFRTKQNLTASSKKKITGLDQNLEGYRPPNFMTGGMTSGIGMNTSRFRGPVRFRTNTENAKSSSETTRGSNLRTQIASLLHRRQSSDPLSTPLGEKNIGNITTAELTNILRHLGIRPAFNPGEQSSQEIVPRFSQPHGILRGTTDLSLGTPGKSGSPVAKSSGQLVRIIDNKRVLIDSLDTGIAPLDSEKTSAIVSNKIPVVITERFKSSAEKRPNFSENFMIVRPVPTTALKEAQTTQSVDVANELSALKQSSVPANSDSQTSNVVAMPTVLVPAVVDATIAIPQNEKNSQAHDLSQANPDTAANNQSKSSDSASNKQPKAVSLNSSAAKQLPESYIQQINKKFKQQKMLKEKKSNVQSNDTNKSSTTASSQPITAADGKTASQVAFTEPVTEPSNADSTTSTHAVPTLDSSAKSETQDVAKTLVASKNQTKSAVLSELGTLITDVQSAKLGHTSAEDLSSRLLELAMQLRRDTEASTTSTQPPKSDFLAKEDDLTPPPLPPDAVGSVEMQFVYPLASSSKADGPYPEMTTNLNEVDMEIASSSKVDGAHPETITNLNEVKMEVEPPESSASNVPHPDVVTALETSAPLEEQAVSDDSKLLLPSSPAGLSTSEVRSYAKDDRPMDYELQVKSSFKKSYKHFSPLSSFISSEIRIDKKIHNVLSKIDQGLVQESWECNEIEQKRQNIVLPSTEFPSFPEPEKSSQSSVETREETYRSFKTQKIAHVKPQPSSSRSCPSFYVFNPRNDPECVRISLLLTLTGKPFQIRNIAEAIANASSSDDDMLVQVTKTMIDQSLNDEEVWIIIRSADIELMPALPFLSLLKCAGPKVNFIQADSAADVNSRKYVNIMSGEFGILMPVSVQVLTDNRVAVVELLAWMLKLNRKKNEALWRLALPKHIVRQLHEYRDNPNVHDTLKIAAHSLLDVVKSHADVIIDVTAADELATSWSTTDVFDVAISLQMRCIDLTRHVVILTEQEDSDQHWNTHRRAGLAVTTVHHFVQAIMDNKREKARGESIDVYSPLIKIYKVEK